MQSNTILYLADDDADDRFLITEAINQVNGQLTIIEAETGQELLTTILQAAHQNIALIMLDMNMPLLNGIETALVIRQYPSFDQVPIVMISTTSNRELIEVAYKSGIARFYTKPSSFDGLKDLVHQLQTEFNF